MVDFRAARNQAHSQWSHWSLWGPELHAASQSLDDRNWETVGPICWSAAELSRMRSSLDVLGHPSAPFGCLCWMPYFSSKSILHPATHVSLPSLAASRASRLSCCATIPLCTSSPMVSKAPDNGARFFPELKSVATTPFSGSMIWQREAHKCLPGYHNSEINGPHTVSGSTVSNTELSEFFWAHWVPGSELSEFLSAYYLCANAHSPSFWQNSPSLPQNSASSLLRNSTLETVFRPIPNNCTSGVPSSRRHNMAPGDVLLLRDIKSTHSFLPSDDLSMHARRFRALCLFQIALVTDHTPSRNAQVIYQWSKVVDRPSRHQGSQNSGVVTLCLTGTYWGKKWSGPLSGRISSLWGGQTRSYLAFLRFSPRFSVFWGRFGGKTRSYLAKIEFCSNSSKIAEFPAFTVVLWPSFPPDSSGKSHISRRVVSGSTPWENCPETHFGHTFGPLLANQPGLTHVCAKSMMWRFWPWGTPFPLQCMIYSLRNSSAWFTMCSLLIHKKQRCYCLTTSCLRKHELERHVVGDLVCWVMSVTLRAQLCVQLLWLPCSQHLFHVPAAFVPLVFSHRLPKKPITDEFLHQHSCNL